MPHAAPADTGRLTVRTIDAQSGNPLPARLVLATSDGRYPGDRLGCYASHWPGIEAHAVFINGRADFDVPAGKTVVTAAHGLEYLADSISVDVEAGKTASVALRLKRFCDMPAAGWFAGDAHMHMIHGENQRATSYEDVATTCSAGGLHFASVCEEYVGAGKLDLRGYEREARRVSTGDFQLFIGGERPKDILGHCALIGVPDPFLIDNNPPYFKTARAIHAAGGAFYYVHPLRYFPEKKWQGQWLDFPGNNLARELIFDAWLGPSFDGVSILSDEPANERAHQLWFNLLNRGFFVPALADSDACFDRPVFGFHAPGFWTTWFYLGPHAKLTAAALAEALRKGRTMATTGPLVLFNIDHQPSGATLAPDGKDRALGIEAYYPQHAWSLASENPKSKAPTGIAKVELIRNGTVVKTWAPKSTSARIALTIAEKEPCWYAVRVFGDDAQWQVALASPIYFAAAPVPGKREPLVTTVRGRVYDFSSGADCAAGVEIRRGGKLLKRFAADGQFAVKMPLDAEIIVTGAGQPPIAKNLLLDYGPVHKFLWYLESADFGKAETLDKFEALVRRVDLEFPVGAKIPGCYAARDLAGPVEFRAIKVLEGPGQSGGQCAVAAILSDARQIGLRDTIHLAAVFHDEGAVNRRSPMVVVGHGYDPARPSGDNSLKPFDSFEKNWDGAADLGNGYRMIAGQLKLADWVQPGPSGAVEISVRVRKGDGDSAFIGLAVPIGPTRRALVLTTPWPTMPSGWPDRIYGIGPLRATNRLGRLGQCKADYRRLHIEVQTDQEKLDLLPARDGRGCADADGAIFTGHFLDQCLSDESHLAQPDPVRPRPPIQWREITPIDATQEP
jgi:hypothetical protein